MTQPKCELAPDEAYDRGYQDGESSGYADWIGALGEVLPDGVELTPSGVAAYLASCVSGPRAQDDAT